MIIALIAKMNSSDSFSTFGTEPRDGEVEGPSWLQRYETVKSHILHKAAAEQETLDPQVAFGALSEPQKARLCKALVRFFTMKQGLAPSLPIPREEAVRIFEAARREASMVPSQRLFPYFLIEARKKLVEIFGLDVVQVEKKIPSEDRKKKKNIKPTMVFYVVSLLPKEVTNQFMDAKESQLMGMIGFVIRLVIASDGKLEKSEAIDLLSNVPFPSLCVS